MKKYYPGNIIEGKVVGVKPYGIFVCIDENTIGLIHISEISSSYIADINKIVKMGEIIKAKILDIDYETGKAKLSLKAISKRRRYSKNGKYVFSEEKINDSAEFYVLKIRLNDFINDAKERLCLND